MWHIFGVSVYSFPAVEPTIKKCCVFFRRKCNPFSSVLSAAHSVTYNNNNNNNGNICRMRASAQCSFLMFCRRRRRRRVRCLLHTINILFSFLFRNKNVLVYSIYVCVVCYFYLCQYMVHANKFFCTSLIPLSTLCVCDLVLSYSFTTSQSITITFIILKQSLHFLFLVFLLRQRYVSCNIKRRQFTKVYVYNTPTSK